jgi:hypothetical protein
MTKGELKRLTKALQQASSYTPSPAIIKAVQKYQEFKIKS